MSIRISKIAASLLLFAMIVVPTNAHAFFGLGGRVINTTACFAPTGAFYIEILTPHRGIQGYIWTPINNRYLHPGVPRLGQNVILLAGATPVPCVGFGIPRPTIGAGFPILFLLHGSSLR